MRRRKEKARNLERPGSIGSDVLVPQRVSRTPAPMPLFFGYAAYLATAISLVAGTLFGVPILTDPANTLTTNDTRSAIVKNAEPFLQIPAEPRRSSEAFRYGPEVNHGRSDTPNFATQLAINQAKAAAASQANAATSGKRRIQLDQKQIGQDPGIGMDFGPFRYNGH